jgi:MFS family permease
VRHFTPLLQLILISLTAHIALVGARVTTSLYALSVHASEFTVGTLIALFSLFPMIFAVPMGRWIDRIGIVKPMVAGTLLMGIGCAIPSMVGGLAVLYLAVILIGGGFLAIHVSTQHAVGAMSIAETRSVNFSWLALGYSVSSFFGPVIAGLIIDHSRHSIAYGIFSGFAGLALLLMVYDNLRRVNIVRHNEVKKSGGVFDLLRDREMRRIYLISVLLGSAWDLFNFVMPIHGSRLGFSASTIGLILGCFSAATFAVRLAMHWISRRYSEWQVLISALSLAVVCYTLFPFMKDPLSLMVVAAALGLALGSGQPNVLALLHHASPVGRAGEAVGIRVTMSNACQVALPLAFGAAGATMGLFAVFWGMGAMIGTGVPLVWRKAFGSR